MILSMKITQNFSKEDLQEQVVFLTNEVSYLKEQLEWFKRQLFGKKSEKTVYNNSSQELEFEGFDKLATTTEEKEIAVPAHKRIESRYKGKDKITIHPDLPVVTTVLDLPKDQKVCPITGVPLVKIGEEITHKLRTGLAPGDDYK